MARALTPQDAHVLMNALVKEATGQESTTQIVDTSSFVSAGEKVLETGVENTINSLALILGRRFMAVRPYKAQMRNINAINTGAYSHRIAKVSFYSRDALASGDWNTQLNPDNLKAGVDNTSSSTSGHERTASMWEQNPPIALEMNFAGSSVWEDSTTWYKYQLKNAFRNEASFNEFIAGVSVEKGNDAESQKEAFNRMTVLSYMAGLYDVDAILNNGMAVNVTKAFNDDNNTSYTTAQLQTTYKKEFLGWFLAFIKKTSRRFENRSTNYHWTVPKTVNGVSHVILRHTPRDKQKLFLYEPFFIDSEYQILPEIYHNGILRPENYEGVMYWQNENNPSEINVTPAIPDVAGNNKGEQKAGSNVNLKYVLGVLFDTDACMIDYQLEDADSTPMEARKKYYSVWWSYAKNSIVDYTEKGVLFYMADEESDSDNND